MQLSNDAYWQILVNNNSTDPMGLEFIEKTESWANTMEMLMTKSFSLAEVAESTSQQFFDPSLGTERILFASALNALYNCWKYGEDLKSLFDQGFLPAQKLAMLQQSEAGNESNTVIDPNLIKKLASIF